MGRLAAKSPYELKRHMALDTQNMQARSDDWSIPLWVKAAVTFFACSGAGIFLLSVLSEQETLFGFSTRLIFGASLALVLVSIPLVLAFWLFPRSAPVLFLYWLIRSLRIPICIFALFGMVYLITIHATPFSVRGGVPAINLILLLGMALLVRPLGPDPFPLPWMDRLYSRLKRLAGRIDSVPVWVWTAAAILLPVALVCANIYLGLHSSLQDYRPYSSWKDETAYWVRLRSFSYVGLNSGYNAPYELVAPAAFSRYGEGSPLYIYLYGSIARLTGWLPQLPILINFVILALAILLFVHFAKLDRPQIVFTGLIAVLTWPVLAYLPMTTQETLNQAIGFILAILFFKLLGDRERVGLSARIGFVFLVYLAALVRLSWGLLLVPVLFYGLEGKLFWRAFWAVLLGLGLYASAALITSYLVPPVSNSIFSTMRDSLASGPRVFMERIADQFSQMFRSGTLNANIAVMFQMAMIIGWSAVSLLRSIRSRLPAADVLQSGTAFDFYNMTTLAVAGLVFYLASGFARTFAPSVLLVYLLLAARRDYKFLAMLLALNLAFFPLYMGASSGITKIMQADFTREFPQQAAWQSALEKQIVFDPAAENPWCNTLLVPLAYYDHRLTLVPPGIGVSFVAEDFHPIRTPLKSKYLLFDRATYDELAGRLHVRLLQSSALGDLYYNLDSGCAENQ